MTDGVEECVVPARRDLLACVSRKRCSAPELDVDVEALGHGVDASGLRERDVTHREVAHGADTEDVLGRTEVSDGPERTERGNDIVGLGAGRGNDDHVVDVRRDVRVRAAGVLADVQALFIGAALEADGRWSRSWSRTQPTTRGPTA